MRKLKLAVIGAGHLGRIHARLLAGMRDVELVAIADPVASACEPLAAECKTQPLADYRPLLGRVDGAVIAAPTKLHHAIGLEFLRRRMHVLVEKPLAATRTQADELVEAAAEHGAVLQVGHVERFNPALTAAAPHLHGVRYVEAVRAGAFSFRSTDIGVVLDLMIHDLDVVLSLVRSPVRHVSALGLAVLGQHEDVARAHLEFENGCVAELKASRVSAAAHREMQVWTEHAYCSIDFAARAASVVRPSETLLRRELDVERLSPECRVELQTTLHAEHLRLEQLEVEQRNAIGDELADFVDSIRRGRAPRVDGSQGRDALALAEQIVAAIGAHQWHGTAAGPIGPLATPPLPILRGPHWDRAASPAALREAG